MPVKRGFWADSEEWPCSAADAAALRDAVRRSGLFDAQAYAAATGISDPESALAHFIAEGARDGHAPNPYFATSWYHAQNPGLAQTGENPLLHYINEGEVLGRSPAPWFDLAFYASHHTPEPGQTLLAHFLARRRDGTTTPMPEFDPAYYLAAYPDVAAAGVDPFEHFLLWGYREGRNPSARFDTRFYQRRHMQGALEENPLLHYRRLRHLLHLSTRPQDEPNDQFAQTWRFTHPGPDFEDRMPLTAAAPRQARVLAFYLPQFHAIAENNRWWGNGFTEWTSIARGLSRFAGHYQPRIPRDLGHYALTDPSIMRRQAEMALQAGIGGFVHYFYWFNGHRLLEAPTEAMLADPAIDMPFCLMWANENWTRRWDGSEHEVLIAQDWRREDEPALIDCLVRHMRDPRYIRLGGRPVLMVYRPALIPDTRTTIARWRLAFAAADMSPLLVMAQSFDALDPRMFGFDAAVEFPPHKLVNAVPQVGETLAWFDHGASMQVYAYDAVAAASLTEPVPEFPLIKTAVPGWDNEARRQGRGLVLQGATPAAYQAWLAALVARAQAHKVQGEAVVCVNAWNEWAEGAYLEPDIHYGAAFLNATARAVAGLGAGEAPGLLLVGHDAFPAGAQLLLLNLAKQLRRAHGVRLEILLLGDGVLRAEYEAVAPMTVAADPDTLARHAAALAARGVRAAIVNSAASAHAVPVLEAAGFRCLLLVHELPRLLAARGLAQALPSAFAAAAEVLVL